MDNKAKIIKIINTCQIKTSHTQPVETRYVNKLIKLLDHRLNKSGGSHLVTITDKALVGFVRNNVVYKKYIRLNNKKYELNIPYHNGSRYVKSIYVKLLYKIVKQKYDLC